MKPGARGQSAAVRALIAAWRSVDLERPRIGLRDDLKHLKKRGLIHYIHTSSEFAKSDALYAKEDRKFHVGLVPVPYMGDIANAQVLLLQYNPGFSPDDYFAEEQSPTYRQALLNNLRQRRLDKDFPLSLAEPQLCIHGRIQVLGAQVSHPGRGSQGQTRRLVSSRSVLPGTAGCPCRARAVPFPINYSTAGGDATQVGDVDQGVRR